ncbi:hypothetical protein KEM56_000540 [Ascosphaera pollenicola]|nr:hypothetical protein KEM56_000540 [Ascosphaera pollenicola]
MDMPEVPAQKLTRVEKDIIADETVLNSSRLPLLPRTTRYLSGVSAPASTPLVTPSEHASSSSSSPDKALRIENIKNVFAQPYPRISRGTQSITCSHFREKYDFVEPNHTVDEDTVVVHAITGKPHRTGRGELSLLATELPQLLSPCLNTIPIWNHETEDTLYDRHVELLASPSAADILRARSTIVQTIRQFFLNQSFMEVNTPIIASAAGGAVARPFKTHATEFPGETLSLRIAPELWLKRLVVSGFDKVFEIGPSFRNEGIDKTHNPEFTTCEFYQAFADLNTLMNTTEELFRDISRRILTLNETVGNTLTPTRVDFNEPFRRLDFIPEIESAIGRPLPDLEFPDAVNEVRAILDDLDIPIPDEPTLPRLLDKLCSEYLEPQCVGPTFIMNHPECLSPLSKSLKHPANGQKVSARAELFIENREVVNLYEEENSPVEQRKKFQRQLDTKDSENATGTMDENYLEVLEWGLPPTGGWGCGIERLTMLFTGAKRIDDVMSFGNLRSVTKASK